MTGSERMRPARAATIILAVAAMLLAPAAAQAKREAGVASAGPPADYTQTRNLSSPRYETVRDVVRLPAYDGEELYLEVVRPNATGRFPVILESSPYHGTLADRDGTRILPEPRDADGRSLGLTGYFAPRGYAVVMMDLRGTGRSEGCLDHLGPKDARDLEQVVEWAAAQGWSNGRVGMTGHSYVGSTPAVAAAQRPDGLATIVPSAGLASMYQHQFQAGVPYFLQWAGPIEAYEQIAIERKLPGGDDFGNNLEDTACGLPNSAAVAGEDQFSGRYADWHLARDWEKGATEAGIPVFLVHGVNDNAARVAAMEWFTRRGGRAGDKLWLGQWDHGSGCCPTRRGIQWTYALHAWFDKQLALRKVDTGPPVELFMSDGTFEGARQGDRTEVLTGTAWTRGSQRLTFHPTADAQLGREAPAGDGSVSFTGDSRGFIAPEETDGATFRTPPLEDDLVLAGQPALELAASVTASRVHLIANLFDESPDGDWRRISQCAINPELRAGLAERQLVVPGERYDMEPPCFAMAHHLRAGHRLVLRVTTSDPDKVPLFATDVEVTVFTGPGATSVEVPVVPDATLYPDTVALTEDDIVEPGPAQPPVSGSVTTLAPGGGVRVEGVTSQYVAFDVPEGFDNAKAVVQATPALPADLDLYLQRRNADGTWSGDIASGAAGELTGETMTTTRLAPGSYRVEVHNWAGPAGNQVAVRATFYNAAGEPGA
jgi:predicted acyl esterase